MKNLTWFGYGLLAVFLLAALVNTASADINADSASTATAGSASGAVSQQGQSININSTVPSETKHTQNIRHNSDTQKIRQNPNVVGQDLITSFSQDLCVGSFAGGGSGAGIGVSFGKTFIDDACVRRRDSTLLHNMGHTEAAKERLCDSLRVYAAMQRVGKPCRSRAEYDKKVAHMGPEN
jgi:hypothetical protein